MQSRESAISKCRGVITLGYIEDLRQVVGHQPLILVRPSVAIINNIGEILLVKYRDESWGIPGGLMELGESVEECAQREVKEEIGLTIKNLRLLEVVSGKQLFTRLANGDEYYNILIGYICTEYEGEIVPDNIEVFDAKFFKLTELPEGTNELVRKKAKELGSQIMKIVSSS